MHYVYIFLDEICVRQHDVTFAIIAILNFMSPSSAVAKSYSSGSQNLKTMSELRTASMTYNMRDPKVIAGLMPSVYKIAFLGQKNADSALFFNFLLT